MTKKHQQEAQPTAAPTSNYEAEYEEFCQEKQRAEYEGFRREFPTFRGGYEDNRQVMQMVQAEIRGRAELAKIDQEQEQLRDALLLPLIYRSGQLAVTGEFADELLSSTIEDSPSTKAERAATTKKKRPNRAEPPDDYDANALVQRYLDRHPKATIRDVVKATGISQGRVAGLDAWKQTMEQRKAAKPPPKKSERRLTKWMRASIAQDDDPAAKLMEGEENEAIWQWLVDQAAPKERAELHRKTAAERAALIDLAREPYHEAHADPDD